MGVERAACEVAAVDFNRGDFSSARIGAQDNFFGSRVLVDIDFAENDAALAKELFGAAAITAPEGSVDGYIGHFNLNRGL